MWLLIGLGLLIQDSSPLQERVEQLLPRLIDEDAGTRLSAEMELSRLGEGVLDLLPQDAEGDLKAAIERVRRAVRVDMEADRLAIRRQSALDESARLWKTIVDSDDHRESFERAQLVALRIKLIEAELDWVREGVLDARQRLLRKLKLSTDMHWLALQPRSWAAFAAVLSDLLDAPVVVEPPLSSQADAVALNDGARTLEDLLENLARQSRARYVVTADSVVVRPE
jgi:hypothetical protein